MTPEEWTEYQSTFLEFEHRHADPARHLGLVGADGTILWAGASLVNLLGLDLAEWVGCNVLTLVHPDDLARAAHNFASANEFVGQRGPGLYRLIGSEGPQLMEVASENLSGGEDDHRLLFEVRPVDEYTRYQALAWEFADFLERATDGAPSDELCALLVQLGERHSEGSRCCISLVRGGRLELADGGSLPAALARALGTRDISRWSGTAGEAIYRRTAVISTDVRSDADWAEIASTLHAEHVEAVWSFPIPGMGATAPALGTIDVLRSVTGAPGPTDWPLFYSIAGLATVATLDSQRLPDGPTHRALTPSEEFFHRAPIANSILRQRVNERGDFVSLEFEAVNAEWTRVTGWSEAEMVGRAVDEFVHPDDLRRVAEQVLAAGINSASIRNLDCRWRLADGSYRWIRGVGSPDPVTGRVFGTLFDFDVGDRRYEDSEDGRRLQAFDSIPAALAIVSRKGTILDVNPAWRTVLAGCADGGMGQKLLDVADDQHGFRVESLLRSATSGEVMSADIRLVAEAGHRWVRMQGQFDAVSDSWYFQALDVTSERSKLEELVTAKAAVDQALVAKDVFLAAVTHELRTPLNSVISFADLLATDLGTAEDRSTYLERISRNGRHLLALIDEIIELSRAASDASATREPVEIRSLLRSLFDEVDDKRVRLSVTGLSSDVPNVVLGDRSAIALILRNLLENACKYGSTEVEVHISVVDDHLRLDVCDDGIGISEEDLPFVLDAFRRGSNAAATADGTGLGLSLADRFAAGMGAQLTVTSSLGEGTVVSLSGLEVHR